MNEIAGRGLERIAAVVDSLQQYATHQMQSAWTEVELDTLAAMAAEQLRPAAPVGAQILLDLRAAALVRGPREPLRQLCINLVENALQAISPGGHVWVSTVAQAGRVRLSIRDDGPGIAPEHRDRIFDLFFTTKPPGKGTGLGLALAKRTVHDLGGEIRFTTEVGKGTEFIIDLPISEARPDDAASEPR